MAQQKLSPQDEKRYTGTAIGNGYSVEWLPVLRK